MENLITSGQAKKRNDKVPGMLRPIGNILMSKWFGNKSGKDHLFNGDQIKGVYFDHVVITFFKKAINGDVSE